MKLPAGETPERFAGWSAKAQQPLPTVLRASTARGEGHGDGWHVNDGAHILTTRAPICSDESAAVPDGF